MNKREEGEHDIVHLRKRRCVTSDVRHSPKLI